MGMKSTYCHKWDPSILEQVAASCNIASSAQNEADWQLFLTAIYESIAVLSYDQRIILLLSQEVGLSYVDIARITGKPISTIIGLLKVAIQKITYLIKARSLTNKTQFDCRALQLIYDETFVPEEFAHGTADFEFLDQFNAPSFSPRNWLIESCGGADDRVRKPARGPQAEKRTDGETSHKKGAK